MNVFHCIWNNTNRWLNILCTVRDDWWQIELRWFFSWRNAPKRDKVHVKIDRVEWRERVRMKKHTPKRNFIYSLVVRVGNLRDYFFLVFRFVFFVLSFASSQQICEKFSVNNWCVLIFPLSKPFCYLIVLFSPFELLCFDKIEKKKNVENICGFVVFVLFSLLTSGINSFEMLSQFHFTWKYIFNRRNFSLFFFELVS